MKNAYSPKKRNTNKRQVKSVVLISVEGKNKTEQLYFDSYNGGNVNVKFARGNETDPVHLAMALKREYENLELSQDYGDRAFCVVDEDISYLQDQKIRKAEKIIEPIHGEMIVSNPCFELWYICHFIYSTRQYRSNQEVITTLKKYVPNYQKGTEDMYDILYKKTDTAIANAKRLASYHAETADDQKRYDCQPRTDVYRIVEFILSKN